jgi:hypothetical protein
MHDLDASVEVVFYSGYKGRETPRAVRAGGQEYPMEKVLWRRRVLDKDTGAVHELFRCRISGKDYTLRVSSRGECRFLGSGFDPLP